MVYYYIHCSAFITNDLFYHIHIVYLSHMVYCHIHVLLVAFMIFLHSYS